MPGASRSIMFRRTAGPPPAERGPLYDLGHNMTWPQRKPAGPTMVSSGRPDDVRDRIGPGNGLVEVVAQHLRARRVAQLRHRLRLDLADALAGHAVDLADLVERAGLAVSEAEPEPYDPGLALG